MISTPFFSMINISTFDFSILAIGKCYGGRCLYLGSPPTFGKLLVDHHQVAFFPVVLIENLGNVFSDSEVNKLILSIIVPLKK